MLEQVVRDFLYGLRSMRRSLGFTWVAVFHPCRGSFEPHANHENKLETEVAHST